MARLIEAIIGHDKAKLQWMNALKSKRLPHALLLVGPSGIGRLGLALAWSQILLCDHGTGCGLCGSCLRVENKQSESLLIITPDKNQIRIEQAHKVLEFLSLRSLSKRRAIIIEGADLLNPTAANSLLKILEEPPPETFFFLIAPGTSQVMSTIRSRSQVLRLQPLTIEELRTKKSHVAEWILKASQGSFEKLQSFSEVEELEVRQAAIMYLETWLKSLQTQQPLAETESAAENYLNLTFRDAAKDRGFSSRLFYFISMLLRDVVMMKLGHADMVLSVDQKPFLESFASVIELEQVFSMMDLSLQMEMGILQNRDPLLMFEDFWIRTQSAENLE